jgi:flagellar basal-body rod protein FlgC
VSGAETVNVSRVVRDQKPFRTEFRPGHPAADAAGYVKFPNVNMIVEVADMREASRSYEASLQVIKQAREMISMTIDLLRGQ